MAAGSASGVSIPLHSLSPRVHHSRPAASLAFFPTRLPTFIVHSPFLSYPNYQPTHLSSFCTRVLTLASNDIEEKNEDPLLPIHITSPLAVPVLTLKEKKELASYAHSLGKKLKSQQVGKGGVTSSVAASFVENLESNELLKVKVHGSCPGEFDEAIKHLEQLTGSVVVSQIGRSVILYRPSITKMKKREAEAARKSWRPNLKKPYVEGKLRDEPQSRSTQRFPRRGSS